jgi:GT2 family glycosyltransferase
VKVLQNVEKSELSSNMLDIVIVNWNSGDQLRACIASIFSLSENCVGSVIVVDNASIDSSLDKIEPSEKIKIIRENKNLGFGKACNIGAKKLTGKYILFLNPDAVLYRESLSRSLRYMESVDASDVGICGIKLMDEQGGVSRSCSRFPKAKGFIAHSFGIDKLIPGLGHMMSEWDHLNNRKVDHVIGAFFMVRREVFDLLNGFDERFFLYLEDLDFSLRASKSGWKTMYFAEAHAFHLGGGTSRQIKAKRLFYSLRSQLTYSRRHFSKLEALAVAIAILAIEPISRSIFSLISFSLSGFKETWIGYGMLWRWITFRNFER